MVSQAARVGAMTISRPVAGSAATKAWRSGGRYLSVTMRCIRNGKVHASRLMRNGPGDFHPPGPPLCLQETSVSVFLFFTVAVSFLFPVTGVAIPVGTRARTDVNAIAELVVAIVRIVVAAIVIVVVTVATVVPIVTTSPLSPAHLLVAPPLCLSPFLVIVIRNAAVQNGETAVRVPTRTLNDQV